MSLTQVFGTVASAVQLRGLAVVIGERILDGYPSVTDDDVVALAKRDCLPQLLLIVGVVLLH